MQSFSLAGSLLRILDPVLRATREKLLSRLTDFARCRRGNAPAFLIVTILIIGASGIAVDTGSLYRMRAMMQATADAAALGGVQEMLENDGDLAEEMAMYFVETNMPAASYGALTTAAEIRIGQWNAALGTINAGATPPNAIGVMLERTKDRNNPLATLMYWIVGVDTIDMAAGAVAMIRWRECEVAEGIIAAGVVDFNSVNRFGHDFCIYGGDGIRVNNNNDFTGMTADGDGALVGMGEYAYENFGCDGVYHQGGGADPCDWDESNPGMRAAHFHSDDVGPTRLQGLAADLAAYQSVFDNDGEGAPDGAFYYSQCEWSLASCLPSGRAARGGSRSVLNPLLYASMILPQDEYRIYYLACDSEDETLRLDSGQYSNMSIITNCMVHINSSSAADSSTHSNWSNVAIITVADGRFPDIVHPPGKNANMSISGGNQFGVSCGTGQTVSLISSQSIEFAGNNRYRDVEVTAVYDLIMAGNQSTYADDLGSFSAHIGGNVYFTSSSDFANCTTDEDGVIVKARTGLVY